MRKKVALPKFVDCCGARIRILRRSVKQDRDLDGAWGYFDAASSTIVVDSRCKNDQAWWVLHHELAHAFLHCSGALFNLQQLLNVENPALLGFVEEVLIRNAMVPHALSCARQACPPR